MDVKNMSESYNLVFKRREVSFFIDHSAQGSPKLYDVRKSLAEKYGADEGSVYVVKLETRTGTNRSYGEAEVYDSAETAAKVVPKHIQRRNTSTRRENKGTPAKETPKAPTKETPKEAPKEPTKGEKK
jgi:small subunit ribosomal protein S24e